MDSTHALDVRGLIERWRESVGNLLNEEGLMYVYKAKSAGDALAAALQARLYCTLCGRETPHDEVVDMETTTRTDIPPSQPATCGLCGEPMPPGEEMFQYHGASGSCPKPVVPARRNAATGGEAELLAEWEEARLVGFRQDRASRMRRAGDAIAAELRKCIKALEVSERNLPPAPPLPIIDCECGACQRLRQKQIERVAPPPAATGDEDLLARVLGVCRSECSIEGALTVDTLATRFRQRGEELAALRDAITAATARAEQAENDALVTLDGIASANVNDWLAEESIRKRECFLPEFFAWAQNRARATAAAIRARSAGGEGT